MIVEFPPGLLLIGGAVLVPFLKGNLRSAYTLILPLLGIVHLIMLDTGTYGAMSSFGFEQTHVRVDKLSLIFGYIFYIAAILGMLFAWHNDEAMEKSTALVYMGAAIGAAFAGDLITLFFYWELAAIASVFLIWAARTDRSFQAGFRCLLIYMVSGVLLLTGIAMYAKASGNVEFNNIGLDSPGGIFIMLAFGIKCAFPLLHNWLQDAYPEASVTGTVFLSAFTTKLAVYALARGFAGTEVLIWIGVAMTAFPIFFAVIENDLRRVLAYSLNNQLGFMVAGIGIGSTLAINGAVSHAFAHIIYKALLFMTIGAVLYRTDTAKGSELGGLYKTMPWTTGFCIVGGASISAFPLFSGFVAKSLTMSAVIGGYYVWTFVGLLVASAGVMEHSGIKIPYFAFFGRDSGIRCQEAPIHMCLAMGIAAALCIGIGCFPEPLYALLPYPVDYEPYADFGHSLTQVQLLLFAALAFAVLLRTGLYPPEQNAINLDTDWLYRRLAPKVVCSVMNNLVIVTNGLSAATRSVGRALMRSVIRHYGPEGTLARTWPTGSMVLWIAVLLAASLVLYFV